MLFHGNGIEGRKILTRWHRGKFDYFHGTEGIDEIFDGIEGILSCLNSSPSFGAPVTRAAARLPQGTCLEPLVLALLQKFESLRPRKSRPATG